MKRSIRAKLPSLKRFNGPKLTGRFSKRENAIVPLLVPRRAESKLPRQIEMHGLFPKILQGTLFFYYGKYPNTLPVEASTVSHVNLNYSTTKYYIFNILVIYY